MSKKTPKARLVKLTIDELSGVDRPCHAPATVAIMKAGTVPCPSCGKYAAAGMQQCPGCNGPMAKRAVFARVVKQAVLTDEVDGHQHTLDLNDPAERWSYGGLSTSYATAAGADNGHSHAWTFDASGAVMIAADSGHTHVVAAIVAAPILAAAAAIEVDEQAAAVDVATGEDVVPTAVSDEPSGPTVVVVNARATNSTRDGALVKVALTSEEQTQMPDNTAEITALTKRAERAEKLATMTDAQRSHFAKLAGVDAEAFLDAGQSAREAIVKTAVDADPVAHTCADGTVIRKSAGELAVTLAKRLDAADARAVEHATAIAKATAETERVTLEKRASTELSAIGKSLSVRAAILKAIDGIADEAVRKEAHEALKGANGAMASLSKRAGMNPGDLPAEGSEDPVAKFQAELVTFAKAANKTPVQATAEFINTPRGSELYAAASPSAQPQA